VPGIDAYFEELRDSLSHKRRFRPGEDSFLPWRAATRARLAELLRLPPGPRLLDVREEPAESVEVRGSRHRRQRVLLRTERELWVPAYLLLPPDADGPLPVTICCQGHAKDAMRLSVGLISDETWEDLVVSGDRDFALQAIRRGHAGLALEVRSFGELRSTEDAAGDSVCSCLRHTLLALQAGRTLMGMRVHDVMAAVDYLEGRAEVDPARIAMTGNSGGGSLTLYSAALDERIAASIPSCAFCTYRDSLQAVDHCACNFIPDMCTEIEMDDLAGLCAPRPQLIISGDSDPIFPLSGVHEAFERLRGIYAAAGAADKLHLHVGNGGHRYYAEPVAEFLEKAFSMTGTPAGA